MMNTIVTQGCNGAAKTYRVEKVPNTATPGKPAYHRVAFERSPDGIVISDASGQVIDANPAALALLGYARDELLRLTRDDLVPRVPSWSEERYQQFLRDGWWEGEVEVRTKDGPITFGVRALVLPQDEGDFHFSFLRDLSERKQSEATRARLAALVTSSGDAIIGETLDGLITDWNPAAERLYGYTAAEVIGHPFAELVPPERADEIEKILERVHAGESVEGFESSRRTKDGRLIDISLTVSPVWNDAQQIIGTSAIVRDISAQKAAERALASSERLFRAVFADAPIGMVLTDEHGETFQVNRAICKLLGYTEAELLATTLRERTYPEDAEATLAFIQRALAGEIDTFEQEKRYLRKDGGVVWVLLNSTLIRDETGRPSYFIAQILDITERKHAEAELAATDRQRKKAAEELRAALETARSANRTKSLFLAMMSHELRTPLQSVLGYADLLLAGGGGPLTSAQSEDLAAIHQGAQRMATQIERMLDLSRVEAGAIEFSAELVDLGVILEEVRSDVSPQAEDKGLALQIELPPDFPHFVGDPIRIRQILLNLASNAVKFTDRGSVCFSANATTEGIDVAVRDTGIGIPAEAMSHIFEEFRQADSSRMRRSEGAGLGLAIARRLAEQMGGSISVTSHPLTGSTFTLHLPRRTSA